MAYSNSYMFLGIGLFVILSSQALANHFPSEPLIHDGVQGDKKSIDYVKDLNNVVYKMPPEPPTYPEINGEELDGQKVSQEYGMAHNKEEEFDLEQKIQEYLNAQNLVEGALKAQKVLTAQKFEEESQEYMKTRKFEEALDEQIVAEHIKAAQKFEEALNEQIVAEHIKATQKLAACESPPNPLTDVKINEEALDDQKGQEDVKTEKFAGCESPPNPLTDHKINEALDDQKDLENGKARNISTASESSQSLTDLEINESKVNWKSFHAKYPWIKMNGHNSIPGSRKLLNDIANDQLVGGLSKQI